jgi:hypothetical protein
MGWQDTLRDVVDIIAPRADATPRADGVVDGDDISPITPSGSHLVPAAPVRLSHTQRRTASASGIGRRVVRAPVELALGRGWEVVSGEDRHVSDDVDASLRVVDEVAEAWTLARQDGLAWLLVMDDSDDPAEPLGEGPHDVVRLLALSYDEVTAQSWEDDPLSDIPLGQMRSATVTIKRPRVTRALGTVHRSRLIRVPGLWRDPTAPDIGDRPGASVSAIEAYWDAIADYEQTGQSIAEVARMMAIPYLQMPGIEGQIAAKGRAAYLEIISRIRRGMGAFGLTAISADSTMGVLSPSLSGIKDVEASQYRRLTAVEGAPADWLLDLQVGGLGGDTEGRARRLQSYADDLRMSVGEPVLRAIYDIALGPDPGRVIVWSPVATPSASEAADIELKRAQASAARSAAMVTTIDEERDHLSGDDPWDLQPREDDAIDADLDEPDDATARLMEAAIRPRADADPVDDR